MKLSILIFFFNLNTLLSQITPTEILDSSEKKITIEKIKELLDKNYVFPALAQEMNKILDRNLKNGKYKTIKSRVKFAETLSFELQSASKDKHINITVKSTENIANFIQTNNDKLRKENFGFKEVKILDGNIGYLNLTSFSDPRQGSETAKAALSFVGNTDALIIDLRMNSGGNQQMNQFIISQFLEETSILLSTSYVRLYDADSQLWSLEKIAGKRNPTIELYILTSSQTFSAAEELAYIMKNLKRATIIGEVSGGAANGGKKFDAGLYTIFVPISTVTIPTTGTNWEGTGVMPDIEVPASEALSLAHKTALEKLAIKYPDQTQYPWLLQSFDDKNLENINQYSISQYTGRFESKEIIIEKHALYFKPTTYLKIKLLPFQDDIFTLEGQMKRVKFERHNGQISAIVIFSSSGEKEKYVKS